MGPRRRRSPQGGLRDDQSVLAPLPWSKGQFNPTPYSMLLQYRLGGTETAVRMGSMDGSSTLPRLRVCMETWDRSTIRPVKVSLVVSPKLESCCLGG